MMKLLLLGPLLFNVVVQHEEIKPWVYNFQ